MFEDIEELKNKNILIIGLGKSGLSVIKKLAGFVRSIIAIDNNPYLDIEDNFDKFKILKDFTLKFILDEKSNENIELVKNIDLVILSPGVPNDIPVIRAADINGIPVWSEVELGWRLLSKDARKNTIAVTGTNGKTTVVTLIQKILADSGASAVVCGNIGNPLINTVDIKNGDSLIRVMEISSFQLERVYQFNPHIGIILNISSDHLDRHHSMDNYAEIKFNLFSNMKSSQWGIFNVDDKFIKRKLVEKNYYKDKGFIIIRYSLKKEKGCEVYYDDRQIHYSFGKYSGKVNTSKIRLAGLHNISNIMSVICAAKIFNIGNLQIEKALKVFETLEHRIEFVDKIKGIKIFNDSKATNPDATIKALESFEEKITLILGGKDKDMDFKPVIPYMERKILNLILIGETKEKILKMLTNHEKRFKKLPFRVFVCNDFENAVYKGLDVTKPGNVLLLSPACASFDMFRDYKDRGEKFKRIILKSKNSLR
jgi:UDP-N-acetylmuramoylalanine--D-glutamate ligase